MNMTTRWFDDRSGRERCPDASITHGSAPNAQAGMVPGYDDGHVGREEGFSVQLAWLGGRDKERWDGDCL